MPVKKAKRPVAAKKASTTKKPVKTATAKKVKSGAVTAASTITKVKKSLTTSVPSTKKKTNAAKKTSTHPLDTEERHHLRASTFAFPKERKEPLNDASHVRNAIARFDQVRDVSDEERDRAWERIKTAAKKFDVHISEGDRRELFKKSATSR
jgi:hypothetical protein